MGFLNDFHDVSFAFQFYLLMNCKARKKNEGEWQHGKEMK